MKICSPLFVSIYHSSICIGVGMEKALLHFNFLSAFCVEDSFILENSFHQVLSMISTNHSIYEFNQFIFPRLFLKILMMQFARLCST